MANPFRRKEQPIRFEAATFPKDMDPEKVEVVVKAHLSGAREFLVASILCVLAGLVFALWMLSKAMTATGDLKLSSNGVTFSGGFALGCLILAGWMAWCARPNIRVTDGK